MDLIEARAATPETWIVVFKHATRSRWLRFVPGKYKHVCAYAYLPGQKSWVFYEVHTGGTEIIVLPHGAHLEFMYYFVEDADLVAMRRGPGSWRPRLMYCVPAIKSLIGLRSGALLPSRLYRDCLAAGGKPLGFTPSVSAAPA